MADEAESTEVDQVEVKPLGLIELGTSGLAAVGGFVTEDLNKELIGKKGRDTFRQMSDNDSVIGAFLFALNQMISRLDWHWEAPDQADLIEEQATEYVQEAFEDMGVEWDAVLEDILTCATYGWAYLEVVYKIRRGPDQLDGAYRSRFDDGKVGWRKFVLRGQNTLLRWELDTNGEVLGMVQLDPYASSISRVPAFGEPPRQPGEVYIPLTKAALFRIGQSKNNPEGRSLLRQAYRPWLFKTRIEEFEAIGIERDLVGYPLVYAPQEWFLDNAAPQEKAALGAAQKLVQNMRRGSSEGAVIPSMFDGNNNRLMDVKLLTSGGQRTINIDAVLTRKDAQIAMSVLADFLMLGHEDVGTRSLGIVKVDLWTLAVQAIAKGIAEVMNRHVVPKLLYLNGMAPSRTPTLSFGEVNRVDLATLGPFLKVLLDAQIITADEDLEEWARKLVNAPAKMGDPTETDTLAELLINPDRQTAGAPSAAPQVAPPKPVTPPPTIVPAPQPQPVA